MNEDVGLCALCREGDHFAHHGQADCSHVCTCVLKSRKECSPMLGYEFVEAVATAVRDSPDIVLADGDGAVSLQWGVSTQPDTIIVQTSEGDVFQVKVERLLIEDDRVPA